MSNRLVEIYDVTLRDGTQGENINFSIHDKIRITEKLDDLGVHYIEGGWPGSNERDEGYFEEVKKLNLKKAKIAAFGSTRRSKVTCDEDANTQALLKAETPVVTIVGKSWDFHVTDALKISLDENFNLVYDSIEYLKKRVDKVFFDAEHFFDGYKNNSEYSLAVLKRAFEAGVDTVILCDTNGGSMPWEIEDIISDVNKKLDNPNLGIHTHNDGEVGVANSLYAIRCGACQVQGTMNGYGERCGNANLSSIIPNIKLKLGYDCISDEELKKLYSVSHFIHELTNLSPLKGNAYIGESAFAHKGGIHVSAVMKNPDTYEHIKPETIGNRRRVLISDLSGRSNIVYKAQELGIDLDTKDKRILDILKELKVLENQGYEFEGADASFELLVRKTLGLYEKQFHIISTRTIVEKRKDDEEPISEVTVEVQVDGQTEYTVATGNGPVSAIDNALRKALEKFFPVLDTVKLLDFRVRVVSSSKGTDSVVRVLVDSSDGVDDWSTVGVSENIVEASWKALADSIDYKLLKDNIKLKD
ncbi:MAG: citramalate synthase [Candidatus Dadabacteria bacterium]|nr:citramalate synthase [Candidatus Dadabacteria bacterium]NIQ16687.1 citramalate synthase [Candidatus Dadabacteria bacterium]